jgi:hypothetical protein
MMASLGHLRVDSQSILSKCISQRRFWLGGQCLRTHLSAPVLARWPVSPNASFSAGWHSSQFLSLIIVIVIVIVIVIIILRTFSFLIFRFNMVYVIVIVIVIVFRPVSPLPFVVQFISSKYDSFVLVGLNSHWPLGLIRAGIIPRAPALALAACSGPCWETILPSVSFCRLFLWICHKAFGFRHVVRLFSVECI